MKSKETRQSLNKKKFSDLSLYSAEYEICQPGHHYGPIYRSYELIHFIVSGKGVPEIDGHGFHLSAGDAFSFHREKFLTTLPISMILGAIPGSAF